MTIDTYESPKKGKYNVVFVLGPPGSGKGTQCKKITEKFHYIHLSAGDLLRDERKREGSEFGELIERHIREGSIVPVEITCKLLENAMKAKRSEASGFLIDGFPRNQDNLDGWERQMGDKVHVRFVLFIHTLTEICVSRCLSRGQGRSDDNEESMKKRIVTYNEHTMPIIQHYNKQGLVKEIDGSMSPIKVFEQIETYFSDTKNGFDQLQNGN